MRSAKSFALWTGWAVTFGLALACFIILIQGVMRDTRWGEPAIPVDFSEASGWHSESFRVWGKDTYTLFISSVNHDPELAGRHLTANFDVRILGADGEPVLNRLYYGEYLTHKVPQGYGDLPLATLEISGKPWRPGTLQVRVREPDPAFRTTRSELKLWKEGSEVGMGGLLNYAFMFPGAVLLALALVLSGALARRGPKWPLVATLAVSAGLLALTLG